MPKLKKLDYAAILLSASVIIIFSVNVYSNRNKASFVKIESNGREFLYPLSRERNIKVKGAIGITEIHIENKTVYIYDSPCPDKLCVLAGKLYKTGQWAACLPNRVFVSIEGGREVEIDDLNY